MKTTVELPDSLLRRAKAAAAEEGKSLKEFLTEAVQMRLDRRTGGSKPWEQAFGGLRHLHDENLRIQKIIDEEFETMDEDQCR